MTGIKDRRRRELAITVYGAEGGAAPLGAALLKAALRLKRQCVVTVLREHALVLADNDPRQIAVRPGQRVIIRPSREKVQFVEFVR